MTFKINLAPGVWWSHRLKTKEGHQEYISSIGRAIQTSLRRRYGGDLQRISSKDILDNSHELNIYPNIDSLKTDLSNGETSIIYDGHVRHSQIELIGDLFDSGLSLSRHDAAGNGLRLGLGTKYFLTPKDLICAAAKSGNVDILRKMDRTKINSVGRNASFEDFINSFLPISLGNRHMLQQSFKMHNIALETGRNPKTFIRSSKNMMVMGEESAERILNEFMDHNMFGFSLENSFFFVQKAYHGFKIDKSCGVSYDEKSPKLLYNHGSMFMEQFIDYQVFQINSGGGKKYFSRNEYQDVLKRVHHMISYNMSDSDFLYSNPDYQGFCKAMELGNAGCKMVMEVGRQEPKRPHEGGFLAYDPNLDRVVVIERDQTGIPYENHSELLRFLAKTKFINRNFNHFNFPNETVSVLREYGLPLHLTAINGYLYPQPPQGDINFLVPTGFIRRERKEKDKKEYMMPIESLKTKADIPQTLRAMALQDNQPGFKEFVQTVHDR